jgi:hypothetical protein
MLGLRGLMSKSFNYSNKWLIVQSS